VREMSEEKEIELVQFVHDYKHGSCLRNPKLDISEYDFVARVNKATHCSFDTIICWFEEDECKYLYLGHWNSGKAKGVKVVNLVIEEPKLNPIELVLIMNPGGTTLVVNKDLKFKDAELIQKGNKNEHDIILCCDYFDKKYIYLGHWNDGVFGD
jgi:hypothetical protein